MYKMYGARRKRRRAACVCCGKTGDHIARGLIDGCYRRHRDNGTLDQFPLLGGPLRDSTPWTPQTPRATERLAEYRSLIGKGITDVEAIASTLGVSVRQVERLARAHRTSREHAADSGAAPRWDDASCREYDPELWFPISYTGTSEQVDEARAVCVGCPARARCLQYAVDNDIQDGIWGATIPSERDAPQTGAS